MKKFNCEKYKDRPKLALLLFCLFILVLSLKDLFGEVTSSILVIIISIIFIASFLPYIKCITSYNKRGRF